MGNEKSNGKKEQMAETAIVTLAKKFGYVTDGKYKGCDVSIGNIKGNNQLKNILNFGYLRSDTNRLIFFEGKKVAAQHTVTADVKVVDLVDINDDVFKVVVNYKNGDFSEINFNVCADPKGAMGFIKKYFTFFINMQKGEVSEKAAFEGFISRTAIFQLDDEVKRFEKEKNEAIEDKDTKAAEACEDAIRRCKALKALMFKEGLKNAADIVYARRNIPAVFYLPGLNISPESEEKLDKYCKQNSILGVMKLIKSLTFEVIEDVQEAK